MKFKWNRQCSTEKQIVNIPWLWRRRA